MDIAQLAVDTAKFLAPYLPYLIAGGKLAAKAAFEQAGTRFTDALWNKAEELWKKLKPKVEEKPVLKEAVDKVARKPEDKRVIGNLEVELEEVFNEDVEFAEIINSIVITGDVINSQIAKGDGNTQQSAGDNSLQIGKIEINIEGGVYKGPAPRNPQDALKIYRGVMANNTKNLSLHGIDPKASDLNEQRVMSLANVYIDLNTTLLVTRIDGKEEVRKERNKNKIRYDAELILDNIFGHGKTTPLSVLEAIIETQTLVIKGDPGSGKSTFVNYLTYCLSSQLTSRLENWKKEDADLLPVVVILRDFIKSFKKLPEKAEPKHIWDFIEKRLKNQNLSSASKTILELLEQGKVILFFDGLDEVTTIPQRIFVRDAVTAFVKRYDKNRYVVTCRILSYTEPKEENEPDLRLPNFPEFEIAPFENKQIESFIEHWYKELMNLGMPTEQANNLAENLVKQIGQRKELNKLAGNPLLLTIMAVVNTDNGQLPDTRAQLYETIIEKLLWQWEQTSKGQEISQLRQLLQQANLTDADLKPVIWQLAYEAHAQTDLNDEDDESLTGIPESKLLNSLKTLNKGDLNWAAKVIEVIKLRAGLLLERENGIFTFPHRSFQEFLAGTYLESKDDFVARAKELANNQLLWRQVILWAVSRKVFLRSSIDSPLALIAELCPKRELNEKEWNKVWLAGDVLLEVGVTRAERRELGKELVPRVQNKLVELIENNHLSPRERADAGNVLAQLGDPRIGVTKEFLFCEIPAGEFLMGIRKEDIKDLAKKFNMQEHNFKSKTPQIKVSLPSFFMSRYPVTNAQFDLFVKADGYKTESYWKEAKEVGYWTENGFKGESDNAVRTAPLAYSSPFNLPNHPVVGVSWYETVAFCKWATEQMRKAESRIQVWKDGKIELIKLSEKFEIRLPSEAEWEYAARGNNSSLIPNPSPKSRRGETIFPWGNEITPNHANYSHTNLNGTSSVGAFPLGINEYDLLDMSGNVWEWCATEWQGNYKDYLKKENNKPTEDSLRVLRGGSYLNGDVDLTCTERIGNKPKVESNVFGFRVVSVLSSISK
ncbi:MAG: SUMF1/EgtB/PvdO family nonheme iron enzyme [Anaerolineales bacterium]|nr:SUMF1/EgtB/PvdO family nonheme iron enzyme [Anaerolineales bacterium]